MIVPMKNTFIIYMLVQMTRVNVLITPVRCPNGLHKSFEPTVFGLLPQYHVSSNFALCSLFAMMNLQAVCPPTAPQCLKHLHLARMHMMQQAWSYQWVKMHLQRHIQQPNSISFGVYSQPYCSGDAALGPYCKSRNDGPPSVMVNGEKANNGDELLHTPESGCLLVWPSRRGQTHDCVSVSHLIMQHLVVYLEQFCQYQLLFIK